MGGWIRLLQVMEGRDFWLDNLIADGEHPVFIDLETIIQPRRQAAGMSASAARVQNRIESSPIVTNIVAMFAPIGPEVGSEDLGCFATPKEFLSPFPATAIPGVTTESRHRQGYRTWTHPEHAPMLDHQPVSAHRWFAAIEAGYREMAETLDALAPELLATGGLVDQMCALPVRTIFRDTWTCIRIIHRSTAPPLLGSYRRRRQFLERIELEAIEDVDRIGPVAAAEVRAMAALDVPFFSAVGSSDAIVPPDGEPVSGFFDDTARDLVIANLGPQSLERLEEDIALLRTSFWTAHPETPVAGATTGHPPASPIRRTAWSDAASHIAEGIAAARTGADDGASSWIALSYHPTVDMEAWSPIGNDLLTGRAGLIACFFDQWRTSGDDRWRELAFEAALEVASTLQQVTSTWGFGSTETSPHLAGMPMLLGAFTGIGGMLATVKQASETLGEPVLERVWQNILDTVDWESALARAQQDVVGGSVGLGLALTARREWIDELPLGLRESLADISLSDEASAGTVGPPGAAAKLAAIPGARVAQLLIRSRLGAGREGELRDSILRVLDSAPTAGDLLGVIELSEPDASWWPRLLKVVTDSAEARAAADRVTQIASAELALAMWRSSGDASWYERVRSLGERWIADFNQSGSWFPADLADDRFRLSTVRGVPAIASVLRRIAGEPVFASPMTLDWRVWRSW
jgi:lantibiotic modifying enzyme